MCYSDPDGPVLFSLSRVRITFTSTFGRSVLGSSFSQQWLLMVRLTQLVRCELCILRGDLKGINCKICMGCVGSSLLGLSCSDRGLESITGELGPVISAAERGDRASQRSCLGQRKGRMGTVAMSGLGGRGRGNAVPAWMGYK